MSEFENGWRVAQKAILRIEESEPDREAGLEPTPRDIAQSALALAMALERCEIPAPHDVYPTPDGNIIFEWQHKSGIARVEVEEWGRGECMVTHPGCETEWARFAWTMPFIDSDLAFFCEEHPTATE